MLKPEYRRWEPNVTDGYAIDYLFAGDKRESDSDHSDTMCFPVWHFEPSFSKVKKPRLKHRRVMMKLKGFPQGPIESVKGKYTYLNQPPWNDLPLTDLGVVEQLVELTTQRFHRAELILIASHEKRRVYFCSKKSFEAYEAAIQ